MGAHNLAFLANNDSTIGCAYDTERTANAVYGVVNLAFLGMVNDQDKNGILHGKFLQRCDNLVIDLISVIASFHGTTHTLQHVHHDQPNILEIRQMFFNIGYQRTSAVAVHIEWSVCGIAEA